MWKRWFALACSSHLCVELNKSQLADNIICLVLITAEMCSCHRIWERGSTGGSLSLPGSSIIALAGCSTGFLQCLRGDFFFLFLPETSLFHPMWFNSDVFTAQPPRNYMKLQRYVHSSVISWWQHTIFQHKTSLTCCEAMKKTALGSCGGWLSVQLCIFSLLQHCML